MGPSSFVGRGFRWWWGFSIVDTNLVVIETMFNMGIVSSAVVSKLARCVWRPYSEGHHILDKNGATVFFNRFSRLDGTWHNPMFGGPRGWGGLLEASSHTSGLIPRVNDWVRLTFGVERSFVFNWIFDQSKFNALDPLPHTLRSSSLSPRNPFPNPIEVDPSRNTIPQTQF